MEECGRNSQCGDPACFGSRRRCRSPGPARYIDPEYIDPELLNAEHGGRVHNHHRGQLPIDHNHNYNYNHYNNHNTAGRREQHNKLGTHINVCPGCDANYDVTARPDCDANHHAHPCPDCDANYDEPGHNHTRSQPDHYRGGNHHNVKATEHGGPSPSQRGGHRRDLHLRGRRSGGRASG